MKNEETNRESNLTKEDLISLFNHIDQIRRLGNLPRSEILVLFNNEKELSFMYLLKNPKSKDNDMLIGGASSITRASRKAFEHLTKIVKKKSLQLQNADAKKGEK